VRSKPILIHQTPDGLRHYRCAFCGWTWGSELPVTRTACPVQSKHRMLARVRALRTRKRRGEPVTVGELLSAAEESLL
jgi:hypothetical protein